MSAPVTVAILGLGGRGKMAYAPYAKTHPDRMKIVAIADIDPEKVDEVAKAYGIPREACYSSAEELLAQPKLADAVFVCTQDRQHMMHTVPALDKDYHVLLEKPISPDINECYAIEEAAKRNNRIVTVCHVLRYAPFFQKIKDIIRSGRLGKVVSIQQYENVGYWHQAHSFVRGNWRNSTETSPMILAKSCHDMDIIAWLMDEKCLRVSSFGSLMHFRPDQAPVGAAERCLGGCAAKETCPYDAEKIYVYSDFGLHGTKDIWPLGILSQKLDEESIYKALREGPYGRCVYHCDNDVVDHQVVNMEFASGATASFTMAAFTGNMCREIKVVGTRGELTADGATNLIRVRRFGEAEQCIDITKFTEDIYGHGGGDVRMLDEFFDLIEGKAAGTSSLTSIDRSIESHIMAFAAEKARLTHTCVELKDMR